jgi:hypothetical protein
VQDKQDAVEDDSVVHRPFAAAARMGIAARRQPDGDFLPERVGDGIVFLGHGEPSPGGEYRQSTGQLQSDFL